jgi:hypothetical protein
MQVSTMQSIPLAPFLTSLAADGIRLTNRDYERIGLVLQTESPWTMTQLKMVLLALLAKDEEQQDLIAQRFGMFFTLPSEQAEAFADIDVQQALADLQGLAQKPRVVLPPHHLCRRAIVMQRAAGGRRRAGCGV